MLVMAAPYPTATAPSAAGATWVQGATPDGLNIAYASRSATFAAVPLPDGFVIIIVGSDQAVISGVTVDGIAANKLAGDTQSSRSNSFWMATSTGAGAKDIVVSSGSNLLNVIITVGQVDAANPAVTGTANLAFGYYIDPHAIGPLDCPVDGFILGSFLTLKPANDSIWIEGDELSDAPVGSGMRFTTGILLSSGSLRANLGNYPGANGVALAIGNVS